jgi:hypothetical protein
VGELKFLTPKERPRMDATLLETLCTDLGPHGAEDVVCRAMEELGQMLFQVHELALTGQREDLHKLLRRLGAIADQIGLCGLAQVARDVMVCIEHGDMIAEAATMARLSRTGERSLSALWDLQDLSV